MKITMPLYAVKVLNRLEERGFEAWAVGGCVRDSLLGREPHDWDLCASTPPDQIAACFPDYRLVLVGLKHGTVTVITEGGPVEVTAFRVDGRYSDGRRPDHVEFTRNLREDLARRDFTMNAIAYHPKRGWADYFGGQEDLRAGKVRCVGTPEKRFGEDALRILRGLRFAARYHFTIEAETASAMRTCRAMLTRLAAERVRTELDGFLTAPGADGLLSSFCEIFSIPAPFLAELSPQELAKTCARIRALPAQTKDGQPNLTVRLAAFLWREDISPGQCSKNASVLLDRLRYDRSTAKAVAALLHDVAKPMKPSEEEMRRWLRERPAPLLWDLLCLRRACGQPDADACERALTAVLQRGDCCQLKDLAVNGRDLLGIGAPSGRKLGELLEKLLDAVICGEIPNERKMLLAYAKTLCLL